MAVNFFLLRNDELAIKAEGTYGVSAGNPIDADYFKSETSRVDITREAEVFKRDADRDYFKASVTEMHVGRRKTSFSIKGRIVPSGVTATPTEPDQDVLYTIGIGAKHKCTAHTTTAAGSAGVTLNLVGGGGAGSGIAIGDLIAVDVDATYGYEVRRVVNLVGDVVTMNLALSANPAAGQAVKTGVTYKLSETALGSAHIWLFNGDNLRFKLAGSIVNEVAVEVNMADGAPTASVTFKGEAQPRAANTLVARVAPLVAGTVEVPDVGRAWIGSVMAPLVQASLSIKNGIKLRNREGDALYPTGLNRTDANSRYLVEQTLEMYLTSGDRDVETLDSGADTLTTRDVVVQLGNSPGKIVAWSTPGWRPSGENTDQDAEIGLKLTGEALGTSGDDNVYLAFI